MDSILVWSAQTRLVGIFRYCTNQNYDDWVGKGTVLDGSTRLVSIGLKVLKK